MLVWNSIVNYCIKLLCNTVLCVGVVKEECSGEFESPLIEELVTSVQERITNWVAQIYGEGEGGLWLWIVDLSD